MSLPIAEKLQSTYESWEGVAESYLYGFSFWKEELLMIMKARNVGIHMKN